MNKTVATLLKVVRRRNPSSAEGRGDYFRHLLLGLGGLPRDFLNFEPFYVRFNGGGGLCIRD